MTTRRLGRLRRRDEREGAAAVEFALGGVLVIVIIMGLMEWGWFLYNYYAVVRSSHYGSRIAAVVPADEDGNADTIEMQAVAEAAVSQRLTQFGVDPGTVTVTATMSGSVADEVEVTLTMNQPALVGIALVPETVSFTSTQVYEYAWE